MKYPETNILKKIISGSHHIHQYPENNSLSYPIMIGIIVALRLSNMAGKMPIAGGDRQSKYPNRRAIVDGEF
jgi:hypothetical protein